MPSFHLDTDSYKHKELTMNVFRIATAISYLFYLSHLLYAEKLTSEYQKSNNQNQSHCANLQLYQVTVAYTTHFGAPKPYHPFAKQPSHQQPLHQNNQKK